MRLSRSFLDEICRYNIGRPAANVLFCRPARPRAPNGVELFTGGAAERNCVASADLIVAFL